MRPNEAGDEGIVGHHVRLYAMVLHGAEALHRSLPLQSLHQALCKHAERDTENNRKEKKKKEVKTKKINYNKVR